MNKPSIYITGDTHGEISRFSLVNLPYENWTYNDILIVLGDFGFVFYDDLRDKERLDRMEKLPFQLCFLDGNHERFPALSKYHVEEWNGGRVHRLRSNIRHLMRGQIYDINGTRLFTMGGGFSIDKAYRREGVSWWPQEMPSEAEYAEAWRNLERSGWKVDYILSHVPPAETMEVFHQMGLISHVAMEEAPLNSFLETVREKVSYKHWYFGHMHMDRPMWRNQTAVFFNILNLRTGEKL